MNEAVSFVQIVTGVTHKGSALYGLTTNGAVYEYNFSREVWIPLPMRALPEDFKNVNVIGLRGPSDVVVESHAGPGLTRRD
jgi:hypothetical protein